MTKFLAIECCEDCIWMNHSIEEERCYCKKMPHKEDVDPTKYPPEWCPLPNYRYGTPQDGTILALSEDRTISLYNKDGEKTGEILFGEKNVTFRGEVDKSADSLFKLLKYVINYFSKDKK